MVKTILWLLLTTVQLFVQKVSKSIVHKIIIKGEVFYVNLEGAKPYFSPNDWFFVFHCWLKALSYVFYKKQKPCIKLEMGTFSVTDVVRLAALQCSYTSIVSASKAREGMKHIVGAWIRGSITSHSHNAELAICD